MEKEKQSKRLNKMFKALRKCDEEMERTGKDYAIIEVED